MIRVLIIEFYIDNIPGGKHFTHTNPYFGVAQARTINVHAQKLCSNLCFA